jgi:hypothetical protein
MPETMFYSYGELDPDRGWIGNEGIGYSNNLMPVTGGYSLGPYMEKISDLRYDDGDEVGVDGEYLGGITYSSGDKLYLHIAVAGGEIGYKVFSKEVTHVTAADLMSDVTPGGWSQGSGNSDQIERWGVQFCIFGTNVYMTDGISGLFYKEAGNDIDPFIASVASDGAANPIPKVLAAHGGHLILGDIEISSPHGGVPSGRSSNLLWWSAFDNPQTFGSVSTTPQYKATDYKFLYDTPGGVIKIVPAGDVVFAFKEKAIYIGEGPPFRWSLLSNSTGTQFPNSTGYYNNGVYFMSDSGPAFVGRDGSIKFLLEGKAQRALIGTSSAFSE